MQCRRLIRKRLLNLSLLLPAMVPALAGHGCDPGDPPCGPDMARVERVVDGDTLVLDDGTRVRILGIDAPESDACFGYEALERLADLVQGRQVGLQDGGECLDRYGRRLARVLVDDLSVGRLLVDEGLACAYFPAGTAPDMGEMQQAQQVARANGRGLWGMCSPVPCR